MKPTAEEEIQFLVHLQRLLSEGSFVATYKYALLMALADICVEKPDENYDGTLAVPVRDIGEKFIHYYWRQTLPYPTHDGAVGVFKQNTGRQAEVVSLLDAARCEHGSLSNLMRHQAAWRSLVGKVAGIVRKMPLWKLQTIGATRLEFLYVNEGKGSQIVLKPGVAHCLRKFHALVGDLIRGAWTRYVRRNNLALLNDASELQEFLFGAERASLTKVRPIMMDVQDGRCFYCERPVKTDTADVDHFVPWSLYPVDLGHNFVVAHKSCNNSKSDRLAAAEHLVHWQELHCRAGDSLTDEFNRNDIVCDLAKSRHITRWAYTSAGQTDSLTWQRKNDLQPLPEDLLSHFENVMWQ